MDILHERDLKAQEQAVSMCQKTSEWGRETACLNKEIWLEIRKKKKGGEFIHFGRRGRKSEGLQGCMRLCREKIRRAKTQL